MAIASLFLVSATIFVGQGRTYDVTSWRSADPLARERLENLLQMRIASGEVNSERLQDVTAGMEAEIEAAKQERQSEGRLIFFAGNGQLSRIQDIPKSTGGASGVRLHTWTDGTRVVERRTDDLAGLGHSSSLNPQVFSIRSASKPVVFRPEVVYALSGILENGFVQESIDATGKQIAYAKTHPGAGTGIVPADAKIRLRVEYADASRSQPRLIEFVNGAGRVTGFVQTTGARDEPGYQVRWTTSAGNREIAEIFTFTGFSDQYLTLADIPVGAKMIVRDGAEKVHEYTWNGQFEEPPVAGFSMPIYAVLFVAGGVAIAAGVWVSIRR